MFILNIKSLNSHLISFEEDCRSRFHGFFFSCWWLLIHDCPAFLLAAGGVGPSIPAPSERAQRLCGSSGNQTCSAENRYRGISSDLRSFFFSFLSEFCCKLSLVAKLEMVCWSTYLTVRSNICWLVILLFIWGISIYFLHLACIFSIFFSVCRFV